MKTKVCPGCGQAFRPVKKTSISCSMKCRRFVPSWINSRTGKNSPQWRGGEAAKLRRECPSCKNLFIVRNGYKEIHCSIKCRAIDPNWRLKITGENHANWIGGKVKTPYGYVMVSAKSHPRANEGGYVFEHILVMEKKLGRYIKVGEHVHHINEKKDDNRPENLEVLSKSEHRSHHSKKWIAAMKAKGYRYERALDGKFTGRWLL